MTREEFFITPRNEVYYEKSDVDSVIQVPVTRPEFEALLKRAAGINGLVVEDEMRSCLAGFIHHIPGHEDTLTIAQVSKVLMKSVSNKITWDIDQECKKKAQEAVIKKANELKDNVTPINPA